MPEVDGTAVGVAEIEVPAQEVISADSHVIEPHDLWVRELPRAFVDRAPIFEASTSPTARLDEHPGAGSPGTRLEAARRDGVAAEVLFPSLALEMFAYRDAAFQQACLRVYNDWLIEYCREDPGRLVGLPAVCAYDIDAAIEELDRCHAAGLQGALLWMVPDPAIPYSSMHYERLWSYAVATKTAIAFHILSGFDFTLEFSTLSSDPVRQSKASSNAKINGVADTMFDLVFSGVFERYPELKVVFGETDAGWIPFYTLRWDYYFHRNRQRGAEFPITRPPSELLEHSAYATFVDDPVGGLLLHRHGQDQWMWSSDFPHPSSTWPNSQAKIAQSLGELSSEVRTKVISANVRNLYRFNT